MPIPTDPLLASQWHLNNTTAGLLDLNVFGVWNPSEGPSYSGAGTRTVVIDDGFDYTHPDFDNYNQNLDFDFDALNNGSNGDNDFDPFGRAVDEHGTAVAGIIGAAADGSGAVGVAHGTELVGYRVAGQISDGALRDIRDSIASGATSANADVANLSLSIANAAGSAFGVGFNAVRFDEIETAIGTAVNTGRSGLGMTIVKAAGNQRSALYDVNADDWANDTRQVVVAAVDRDGFVSSYSSYGAAILVSGFGTPGQVFTTDRVGADGYSTDDFTFGFSGTSAAAPMVTGVVSLMYEANGGLGWRDVQSILASSARHVGSAVGGGIAGSEKYNWNFNAAGTWNGGGQHFSNDYGYGLVDALAAVRLAETWLLGGAPAATSINQFTNTIDVLNASTVIPNGDLTGLSFTGTAGADDIVERVTVQMTFSTAFTADLNIYLTSPDGTVSRLIDSAGADNNYNGTWTFESQAFRGERAAGNWTVRVVDDASGDVLTVSDIVIRTYGAFTIDDRYVYTNELSDYAGIFGHTTNVIDSNGGIDTVNAAAVSSSSIIYLDGAISTSTIDGVNVNFQNIEDAIGGDGSDAIVGTNAANQLFGQRGNDELKGAGGADTLFGDWGNDVVYGGADGDLLYGGDGADSVYGGDGVDLLYGGEGGDILDGGLFKDDAFGGAGNDTFLVTGNVFADNVYGGVDTDTLDLIGWTNGGTVFNVNLSLNNFQLVPNLGPDYSYDAQDIENVIGSNFNDTITGDSLANTLSGSGGGDTVSGGDGVDTLNGGDGADTLNGDAGGDVLFGDAGNDTLQGGAGVDTLIGGADNDTLDGGADEDNAYGGIGNDTFKLTGNNFGDNVYGGADNDVLDLSGFTVSAYKVNLQLQTYEELPNFVGANGIHDLQGVENVRGTNFNDVITGDGLANILVGGLGADTMAGGGGDDSLYVDNAGDTVSELVAGGVLDTIFASITFTSFANVERMYLTGAANINGTGVNGQNDIMYGNTGANILNGLGGTDNMNGGNGSDSYYVNTSGDVVNEAAGAAAGTNDTVFSQSSYTINANVERLFLLDGGNYNANGRNGQNDFIAGNTGNNIINGFSGDDTIKGGLGNDTLTGGTGLDTFQFLTAPNTATNRDTITDFSAADDTIQLDNFVYTLLAATGVLAANLFKNLNLGAQDADDRILYNDTSGAIFYDTNGLTAGGVIQFATLTSSPTVTNADFVVV